MTGKNLYTFEKIDPGVIRDGIGCKFHPKAVNNTILFPSSLI